ncbi:MAG TPA: glycine--tRNA ligase subunit beta [Thermoanaerobaculia bacterium]|nr:glycine--tRNA ligase subunit beta [Thermoanaerobaculia bacterium]
MSDGTRSYFFEVLTEEIPAWMLPPPRVEAELLHLYATELGIAATEASSLLRIGATSRRIYFQMAGLPEKQEDHIEEIKGPPRKISFGADGSPAPALLGFLKKNQATLDDVQTDQPGDDYIRLKRTVPGKAISEILTARIPGIIESIRWPKMMRWGGGERSWIRPVHSVVSILDGSPLPIEILGVPSGIRTRGHRILTTGNVTVGSYEQYIESLGEAHVVADPAVRESMMRQRCRGLAEQVGGTPADDETIWSQWRYLTEFPGIVRAEFDEAFLQLPEEVLITVMRVHQKQLPIMKEEKLSSFFLAVMDLTDDHDGNVASGNAFVTNARFADARFFYETDRKRKLEERVADLAHLQFQEKLGDYAGKTSRIVEIARRILEDAGAGASKVSVTTAARLAKADLMTEMVREFTELQGKIGGIYASEEGYPDETWMAIYDHYLPLGAEGALPRNLAGAIVSVADRIDTLSGFFLVGMKPTGSKDPFALRRTAQGVVQILANRDGWELAVPVESLIHIGLDAHNADVAATRAASAELLDFFAERVRTLFENTPHSLAYDEVAAVMASGWSNSITDALDRAKALREIRNQSSFLSILDSAKRIANITADASSSSVDRSLLVEPAEKRLADLAHLVRDQIDELVAQKRYREALDSFAAMAPELENFFNEVLVMVEDPAIRDNRMALLQQVGGAARMIADVTRVVVDRSDYASGKKG